MDFEEFSSQIKDADVRGMVILQLAMMSGALFFGIAILAISFLSQHNGSVKEDTIFFANILSAITGLLTFNGVIIYNIIAKVRYNSEFVFAMFDEQKSQQESLVFFVSRFRGTRIIQIALLEGAALMGIISYFLTSINGIAQTNKVYLLNYLPLGVLLVVGIMTLPSKQYLYNKYQNFKSLYDLIKPS